MFFRPKTQTEQSENPKSITSRIFKRIKDASNSISDKIDKIVKWKKDTLSWWLFTDELDKNHPVDIIKFDQNTWIPIYNEWFLQKILWTKSDIKKEFWPDFTISWTPEVNSISINWMPLEDIKNWNIPNVWNTIEDTLNSLKKHEIYKTILDKSGIDQLKINWVVYSKIDLLFILDWTKKIILDWEKRNIYKYVLNKIEFIIWEIIWHENVNQIKNNQIDWEFINNLWINKPNNFLEILNNEVFEISSKNRTIKIQTKNKKNEISTNFIVSQQEGWYKIITDINLFTITNWEDWFETIDNWSSINLNEKRWDWYVRIEANTKWLKITSNWLNAICNPVIWNELDWLKMEKDKIPQDIYVLWDSHGSLEWFKANLTTLWIIDEKWSYIWWDKRIILLWDILCDRNTNWLEILKLIKKLNSKAKLYWWEFILISWNHEFEAVKLFLWDILKQPKQFLQESASRWMLELFYYNWAHKIVSKEDFIRMFWTNDKGLIENYLIEKLTKRKELLSIKPKSRKVLPTDNILDEIIKTQWLRDYNEITKQDIENISRVKTGLLYPLLSKSLNFKYYRLWLTDFSNWILENMKNDEKWKTSLEVLSKSYLCRQIGTTLYTHTPLNTKMSKLIAEYWINRINEIFQDWLKNVIISKDINKITEFMTDNETFEKMIKMIETPNIWIYKTLGFIKKILISEKIDNADKIDKIVHFCGDFLLKIKDKWEFTTLDKNSFVKDLKILLLWEDFEKITQVFLDTNNKGEEISNETKKVLNSIWVTSLVHGHTKKTYPDLVNGIKSISLDWNSFRNWKDTWTRNCWVVKKNWKVVKK